MAECKLCAAPLGQETQDLGFQTCHKCRLCVTCGKPLLPCESNYCITNTLPQKHAKCVTASDLHIVEGMGLQPVVDLLNLSRLLSDTTKNLEEIRSLDKTFEWLRMLQAEAAKVSVLIHMDRKALGTLLTKEKHERDSEKAKSEALTSTRPVSKAPGEPNEKAIGMWIATYGTSRKQAITDMHLRDKAIDNLHKKMKLPYDTAVQMAEEQFAKKYADFVKSKQPEPSVIQ